MENDVVAGVGDNRKFFGIAFVVQAEEKFRRANAAGERRDARALLPRLRALHPAVPAACAPTAPADRSSRAKPDPSASPSARWRTAAERNRGCARNSG